MAKFNNGYNNITVELINWDGDDLAKKVYEFGCLSHDYYKPIPTIYDKDNSECNKLLDKLMAGKTLPKYLLQGTRIAFRINNISRICLAQITRDPAIFASASTGVFPLTQEFNMPMSIYEREYIMDKIKQAQKLLEEAYIMACEAEIPSIEARYIGLHPQVISLTASYTLSDFVRASYSRTSSNFCDECNYVYRLMFRELTKAFSTLSIYYSSKLYKWVIKEKSCINDADDYSRERLFNSDFTSLPWYAYMSAEPALNDWRKSGWKMELERMYNDGNCYLTDYEKCIIDGWRYREANNIPLDTTYNGMSPDVLKNAIKDMGYYKEYKNDN